MASYADAAQAKTKLKKQLGRPSWLRGIGITGEPGDYCLKVNVSALTAEVQVPTQVDQVAVIVQVVGDIKSLKPYEKG